jgi:hypothetical protein
MPDKILLIIVMDITIIMNLMLREWAMTILELLVLQEHLRNNMIHMGNQDMLQNKEEMIIKPNNIMLLCN